MPEKLDSSAANGGGPVKFSYPLSPQVSVETVVTGTARNIAGVTIYDGSVPVWAGSMNQAAPTAEVPYQLLLGTMTIESGATFHLTIPTSSQIGNMVMSAKIASGPNPPQPFTAMVAQWPLSSTAAAA